MEIRYSEFKRVINLWREIYVLEDVLYWSAVNGVQNKLKVGRLDERDVFRYILVFLRLWGVKSDIENYEAAEKLADVINDIIPEIERLRDKSLLTIEFDKYERNIKAIYTKIDEVKGIEATATSKILHLLNPDLFVMWDQNIRSKWKVSETAAGYIRFMRLMQKVGNELIEEYMKERGIQDKKEAEEMLSKEYCGKSVAKLLDEYNWLIATGREEKLEKFGDYWG